MRTVLILGAGASRASQFALPTMRGFFADGLDGESRLAKFLSRFYKGLPTASYNLEEVLAYLDISRHRAALWGYAPEGDAPLFKELYDDTLRFIQKRLKIDSNNHCLLHRDLIGQLEKEDSIVSMNYDLIVENSRQAPHGPDEKAKSHIQRVDKLAQLIGNPNFWGGQPPSLLDTEKTEGFFLKLHGSLDWVVCPTIGCANADRLFAAALEQLGAGQGAGQPCRRCGALLDMFIVPPVASKRIEDRGRLALLWSLAIRALRDADRWIVIGVSLAPSDLELRWLFRAALEARPTIPLELSLADPDADARERFGALVPPGAELHRSDYAGLAELLGNHAIEA